MKTNKETGLGLMGGTMNEASCGTCNASTCPYEDNTEVDQAASIIEDAISEVLDAQYAAVKAAIASLFKQRVAKERQLHLLAEDIKAIDNKMVELAHSYEKGLVIEAEDITSITSPSEKSAKATTISIRI